MPYDVKPLNGKFAIIRKADGVVVGHSDTKQKALASVRARMSGEHGGVSKKNFNRPKDAR